MKDNFILLGADHLGLPLKNVLKEHLINKGYSVEDIGAKLTKRIAKGDSERGILCCGTGAGMAIVANKIPGVRAVCINDPYTAERAIASNNAQVVTLGSLITGEEVGKKLVDIWLENDFQGGKSLPKVEKINKLDSK